MIVTINIQHSKGTEEDCVAVVYSLQENNDSSKVNNLLKGEDFYKDRDVLIEQSIVI